MLGAASNLVFFFLVMVSIFASTANADVQIMLTGEFHKRAIYKHDLKDFAGDWYAICQSNDRDTLKRVNIVVEQGTNQNEMDNIVNNECDNTLFLVRNLKGLSNRDLPRYTILQSENSTTIATPKSSLTINKQILQDKEGFKLYTVYKSKKQKIYETPFIDESGGWELIWAGDINLDGIPDFAIKTSHKYSSYQFRLFLSNSDKSGVSYKEAAMVNVASAM